MFYSTYSTILLFQMWQIRLLSSLVYNLELCYLFGFFLVHGNFFPACFVEVRIMTPPKTPCSNPWNEERYFVGVIMLRILRWEDHPGLSGWTQCNHESLCKRHKEGQSQREILEDTTLLALKLEHGATRQGMRAAYSS